MLWLFFQLLVSISAADLATFSTNLKSMAHRGAWGAANERKYGKDMGSWDHIWAKALTNLDAVKEAIDDDTVANLINTMSVNAAWGAANERAWGKRSSSQVDWNMHTHDAGKLEGKLNNDKLVNAIQRASFTAAWWAANAQKFGDHSTDAERDSAEFTTYMKEAKDHAPKNWPLKDIEALFKNNAWAASSHRHASLSMTSFMKDKSKATRSDWVDFEQNAQALKKYLGPEQVDLFEHLESMVLTASWGAVNERTYGKRANSARLNWEKFNFHSKEGKELYKGPVDWQEIVQMISSASWGAANERAYGADSQDARDAWKRFEEAAAKVVATGDKKGEL